MQLCPILYFNRFTIYMRRKPLYYVMNIMLPCLMLSLLDLLVFCLPPESGEKVSLGITVLLSFSVFLLVIADNVPQTSETAPLLGKTIRSNLCVQIRPTKLDLNHCYVLEELCIFLPICLLLYEEFWLDSQKTILEIREQISGSFCNRCFSLQGIPR